MDKEKVRELIRQLAKVARIEVVVDEADESKDDKEPTNHRPAAMAAIKAELEAQIRKSEAGMEERWWPEISNEVKKLVPVMMAAPDLLEAGKEITECAEYVLSSPSIGFYRIPSQAYISMGRAINKAEGKGADD